MYTLHHASDTAALIVRLALDEIGQPYRIAPVERDAAGAVGPAYLALNPQGLIPVLETPDGAMFETGAILLWLADRYGQLAPGAQSPDRAAFLSWLFFVSNTLHADLRALFYPHRHAPAEGIAAHHALCSDRIARHFGLLDQFGGQAERSWLGGENASALDYYTCALVRWAVLYPKDAPRWFALADYPFLADLARRTEGRAPVLAAARAEGLGAAPFSDPRLPV